MQYIKFIIRFILLLMLSPLLLLTWSVVGLYMNTAAWLTDDPTHKGIYSEGIIDYIKFMFRFKINNV